MFIKYIPGQADFANNILAVICMEVESIELLIIIHKILLDLK